MLDVVALGTVFVAMFLAKLESKLETDTESAFMALGQKKVLVFGSDVIVDKIFVGSAPHPAL
jgi:hypothetical protein